MDINLVKIYKEIEKDIDVKNDYFYGNLVNPADNNENPIHNWFRFKEAFSNNLLNNIVYDIGLSGDIKIFDPFCGSGTTLLSGMLNNKGFRMSEGAGTEVNPFIHFVAVTKANFYRLNIFQVESFLRKLKYHDLRKEINENEIPMLSTFEKGYTLNTLTQLINLKKFIKTWFSSSSYEYNFCLLALAAILEETSCMIKSGRALKINKSKKDHDVLEVYLKKIYSMIQDVKNQSRLIRNDINVKLNNCDFRNASLNDTTKYDLIIFSPPYLNHFDYTEVYKLELWMLDFVKTYDDFKALRYKTLRSHPSVKFKETAYYKEFKSNHITRLIDYIESKNHQEVFYETIKGYIDDMYLTFRNISRLIHDNSYVVCIVGNSLFGTKEKGNLTPVATDLIICEVAKECGFEVIELKNARKITRRGVPFPKGRESIIIMKYGKSQAIQYSQLRA